MQTGTVKWFNEKKGWGFIQPDGVEEGKDIFVHHTAIVPPVPGAFRTLKEGERVTFETQGSAKGPKAINVRSLTPQ